MTGSAVRVVAALLLAAGAVSAQTASGVSVEQLYGSASVEPRHGGPNRRHAAERAHRVTGRGIVRL